MKLHHLHWFCISTTVFNVPLALLGGVLLCLAPSAASAQSVTFAGTQATIYSNVDTFGLAVDGSGNIFVTDPFNGYVQELLAVNGSVPANPTIETLASGILNPVAIAVDATGDVFFSDGDTNFDSLKEILAVNGSIPANPTIKTLACCFDSPFGIAVDANGNVFVADTDHNAIKEILAVNGSIPSNPTINTLASGFNMPLGVAVDAQGNVYVADTGNNAVTEILAVGGSIPSSPTIKNLGSGFSAPSGVAVDASGNVYVVQSSINSSVIKLKEILAVGGSIPSNPTITPLASSIADGGGVAVDGRGDVFVVDIGDVVEVRPQNVNFGSVSVCPVDQTPPMPCSNTLTLNYNVTIGGTLGTPQVLTMGAPNLDFTLAFGSTCSGTVTAESTCALNVTFTPTAPGQRKGAVEIVDGSGNVLATTYIYGTGTGPAIAFSPSPQITLWSGSNTPFSVAVDASGNLFFADYYNHAVKEILAAGGYTTVKSLGGGFVGPEALAVDGAGNVFVADPGNYTVKEILASGAVVTLETLSSVYHKIDGVAVDGNGNLFVADRYDSAVKELLEADGYVTIKTLGSGLSAPNGVAVDEAGNVFVADYGHNAVKEILATGGYTTVQTLGSGFLDPISVAVDASGNVFVADRNDSAIKEILAAGGYNTVNSLGSGFSSPVGVAVDGTGNVFVADETDRGQIVEIQRSQPPSLSFIPTPVGSTSSDSLESVVIQNIGNSTLTGGGTLSDLLDFTVGAGPGVVPDCNGVLALVPGAECDVSLSFTPHSAGQLNATLTLSDNSLNGNPAIQTIQMSGIGGFPQIAAISPNYGAPAALINITGTNFGATQDNGSVTVGGGPAYVVSWSNTAITIQVPSRATTGNILVTVDGEASNGAAFTLYPYPAISGISPGSGPIGTAVTITGSGLLDREGDGVVTFNGIRAAIVSQSSTSIQVDVPTGATTGLISVHANGDTVKSFTNFTVTNPQISAINPNYGAPAALIKIAGTNFGVTQGNGSVTVGGAPSYAVSWSNTLIDVQVPSRATTGNIVVTADGESSNGAPFTFYPYPAITEVSPGSGTVGTSVTITGANLMDGEGHGVVTFNGTPAAILSQSSTSIQVEVPAGATSGPVSVYANGNTVKSSTSFTVAVPQIDSISPNYGAPAAVITITGTGFGAAQGNSYVTINGALCGSTAWSNTSITIRVPSDASSGNVVVRVEGEASSGVAFTFYSEPSIATLSAESGAAGTSVTINGNNLLDGGNNATVTFNGTPAAITSDSSGSIQVAVPTGATSGRLLVRVNGVTVIAATNFTITPAP